MVDVNPPLTLLGRAFDGFERAVSAHAAAWPAGGTDGVRATWLGLPELEAAVLGPEPPDADLLVVPADWLPALAASGRIRALTPYLDAGPAGGLAGRLVAVVPRGHHLGRRRLRAAVPRRPAAAVHAAVAARRARPRSRPTTWSELLAQAAALQEPGVRAGTVLAGKPDGHNNVYDLVLHLRRFGGDLVDADGRDHPRHRPDARRARPSCARSSPRWSARPPPAWTATRAATSSPPGRVGVAVNWAGYAALAAAGAVADDFACAVAPTHDDGCADRHRERLLGHVRQHRPAPTPTGPGTTLRHAASAAMDLETTRAGRVRRPAQHLGRPRPPRRPPRARAVRAGARPLPPAAAGARAARARRRAQRARRRRRLARRTARTRPRRRHRRRGDPRPPLPRPPPQEHPMTRIVAVDVVDLRFPTSLSLDGSDAMNKDADYSAAYVVLRTDDPDLAGHGFTFTIGRGNDLCVLAARAPRRAAGRARRRRAGRRPRRDLPRAGLGLAAALARPGQGRRAPGDGRGDERRLGPRGPGRRQAAVAAARRDGPRGARRHRRPQLPLRRADPRRGGRDAGVVGARTGPSASPTCSAPATPATRPAPAGSATPTTSCAGSRQEAVEQGYRHVKLKVGADLEDDIRRCSIAREVIGWDANLMIDANQVWDVPQAIEWVQALAEFKPLWIEEPTSPDDVLGHAAIRRAVAPIGVATGEHGMNRVLFKQLFQAEAIDFCQLDAARLAAINEILPVYLMAHEVRRPGLPARRRRRALRARAAPVGLRLRRRLGHDRAPGDRVRRPPARALRRPVRRRGRRLRAAVAARLQRRDQDASVAEYAFPDGSFWAGRQLGRRRRRRRGRRLR